MSKTIRTYEDASARIAELTLVKNKQEEALVKNLKDFYESHQPKNLIKKAVRDLAHDNEFKEDGVLAAKNVATDLIVGRLFNKNNSVKGYITTFLIEKLALPFLKKNKDKILSFVNQILPSEHKSNE